MLRKINLFLLCTLASGYAKAQCELDLTPPYIPPYQFTISSDPITVDADAPMDLSNPIRILHADPANAAVSYIHCTTSSRYGKSVINLQNQDASSFIFPTNIAGIGIKVLWNNGSADSTGEFPTSGNMTFNDDDEKEGRWNYPDTSLYKIEIYKTADTLKLSNPNGDSILPPGDIAYNWVNADSIANYAQKLSIGDIRIISTPSCQYDNSKVIDFGTVTGAVLRGPGVERNLDFNITCKTDYGSYSTSAAITTETPTTDNLAIKVKDASGSSDAMKITIRDSNGSVMPLDGSKTEKISSLLSNNPAEFKWKATLLPVSSTSTPADGDFTAHAEILLQVN